MKYNHNKIIKKLLLTLGCLTFVSCAPFGTFLLPQHILFVLAIDAAIVTYCAGKNKVWWVTTIITIPADETELALVVCGFGTWLKCAKYRTLAHVSCRFLSLRSFNICPEIIKQHYYHSSDHTLWWVPRDVEMAFCVLQVTVLTAL